MERDRVYRVECKRTATYTIKITNSLSDAATTACAEIPKGSNCLIVTTPTVYRLYGQQLQYEMCSSELRVQMLVLDCDEKSKRYSN